MHQILEALGHFVISVISTLGYAGVVVWMAIESACIPLPSEIIMPFSGYLVSTGRFSLWWVSVAGAFGCVVGSVAAYYLGAYAGRSFIERYGRFVLVTRHDLDLADRWFAKYGHTAIFEPVAAGRAHLHLVSGRRGTHAHAAVRLLHVPGLSTLLPRPTRQGCPSGCRRNHR